MERESKYRHGDELTLKELILKMKDYGHEVLRSWLTIVLISLPVICFFVYKHYTHVPEYKAELRFVVEGQGGSGGGLSSLLGTFGIKKGGRTNPYKILEVGRSSKIFEKVIFKNIQDTTVAKSLIKEYNLLEQWSETDPKYTGFKFLNNTPTTRLEKTVLKKLKTMVWGGEKIDGLCMFKLNEDNGIYSIKCSTSSEELSINLTNYFYDEIKLFFEEEVFQNQKKSAEILAMKSDSINSLKNEKIHQLARFEDRNMGLIAKSNSTKTVILKQEIQALGIAYSELIKNYEMTDVNLKDLQPIFMDIDRPYEPLKEGASSLLIKLLLGAFIGGFLGVLYVVFRKVFNEIMT